MNIVGAARPVTTHAARREIGTALLLVAQLCRESRLGQGLALRSAHEVRMLGRRERWRNLLGRLGFGGATRALRLLALAL